MCIYCTVYSNHTNANTPHTTIIVIIIIAVVVFEPLDLENSDFGAVVFVELVMGEELNNPKWNQRSSVSII